MNKDEKYDRLVSLLKGHFTEKEEGALPKLEETLWNIVCDVVSSVAPQSPDPCVDSMSRCIRNEVQQEVVTEDHLKQLWERIQRSKDPGVAVEQHIRELALSEWFIRIVKSESLDPQTLMQVYFAIAQDIVAGLKLPSAQRPGGSVNEPEDFPGEILRKVGDSLGDRDYIQGLSTSVDEYTPYQIVRKLVRQVLHRNNTFERLLDSEIQAFVSSSNLTETKVGEFLFELLSTVVPSSAEQKISRLKGELSKIGGDGAGAKKRDLIVRTLQEAGVEKIRQWEDVRDALLKSMGVQSHSLEDASTDEEGNRRELQIADQSPQPVQIVSQRDPNSLAVLKNILDFQEFQVILLRSRDNLSSEEIAERLAISEANVRKKLSRARRKLKKWAEEEAARTGRTPEECFRALFDG